VKAQYVGDIGDFGKVLLLKHLSSLGFKIGVNWVLTKNDETNAGEHRNYVDYSGVDCLCCSDKGLLEGIVPLARTKKPERRIGDLKSLIHEFSKDTVFYSEYFDEDVARSDRDNEAFDLLSPEKANLVFFDPDNGISTEYGTSSYHVYRSDLKRYWDRGQSLLIYHHLAKRESHPKAIKELKEQLQKLLRTHDVKSYHFRRGTARVYLLCLRAESLRYVPEPEEVNTLAPLLVSKSEWHKERKENQETCSQAHPWQSAN
jgi:hypothetical protein